MRAGSEGKTMVELIKKAYRMSLNTEHDYISIRMYGKDKFEIVEESLDVLINDGSYVLHTFTQKDVLQDMLIEEIIDIIENQYSEELLDWEGWESLSDFEKYSWVCSDSIEWIDSVEYFVFNVKNIELILDSIALVLGSIDWNEI